MLAAAPTSALPDPAMRVDGRIMAEADGEARLRRRQSRERTTSESDRLGFSDFKDGFGEFAIKFIEIIMKY